METIFKINLSIELTTNLKKLAKINFHSFFKRKKDVTNESIQLPFSLSSTTGDTEEDEPTSSSGSGNN